jgi:CRISPR-associated protein (TIGR02584 family)
MNSSTPRKVLMCVSGMSPAVISETLYALITQDEPFIPDEIHVVTTLTGKDKVFKDLLTPQTGHFHRLMADYLPGRAIRFDESTVHVISQEKPSEPARNPLFDGLLREPVQPQQITMLITELADIQTNEDNEAAANTIYREMRKLKARPGTLLHASVAGGRKSMSFYMGHAFSLLADVDDSLSHVLVSEPFENWQLNFYYPPRTPQTLSYLDSNRQRQEVSTADAHIELAGKSEKLSVLCRAAGPNGAGHPQGQGGAGQPGRERLPLAGGVRRESGLAAAAVHGFCPVRAGLQTPG